MSPYSRCARSIKPSESRLNSRITPMIGEPFGPGGRVARCDFLPADMTRASSLIEGFDFIKTELLQKIRINSRLALRNYDCANCFPIKLNRTRRANNSINISELAQTPQRRYQQSPPNASPALALDYAGRTKESLARAFVTGKANHSTCARCYVDGDWLICKADRNFISPGDGKIRFDEIAHRCNLERLSATNVDPCF